MTIADATKAEPSSSSSSTMFQEPEYASHCLAMFEAIYQRQQAQASQQPINVTLRDGKVEEGKAGVTTPLDIAERISKGLARNAVISKVNGVLWDLHRPLEEDCSVELFDFDSAEGRHTFWHSSAHILGEALEWRYGGRLCVGPPLEDGGFYYDVHIPNAEKISTADYKDLEKFVNRIVKEKQVFQRVVLTKAEALEMFKFNPFKQEIITDKIVDGTTCTAYRCGPLIDLCRGPHLPNTGVVKAFAVTKNSGSYWKGQQDRDVLQRVYGISFPSKKQLKEWKELQKMAEERDHRRIGRDQKLFFFHELSPGSCFFLPNGARVYNGLVRYIRSVYWRRGYDEVITPNVYNVDLWKTSGHYQHYADNMFSFEADKTEFAMKPMNCPGHCLMFRHQKRSYRELPIRMADFGVLHRNELAGALTGLTRVRRFQQDDGHIFCRADQVQQEVSGVLDMLQEVYGVFGFTFTLALSTRPEKSLGGVEAWDAAEQALKEALDGFGEPWTFNHGDGAFYGPKIDIEVTDALRRKHQCATIQLDFQLPLRFQLQYTGTDGSHASDDQVLRPVMIHRAILGSVERFFAIITEHTGGKWPFWISPRQAIVVPVSEAFLEYAQQVRDQLHEHDFYVDVDTTSRTLNKKVREAQLAQYNFILVVGKEEVDGQTVNIRTRNNKVHGTKTLPDLIDTFETLRRDFTRDEDVLLLSDLQG